MILVPLRVFHPEAHLIRAITESKIRLVEETFTEIQEMETRLADLINHPVVDELPILENNLKEVRTGLDMFHANFRAKIRGALPSIRDNKVDEDELLEILKWRNQAPCNGRSLATWLQDMEGDCDVIASLLLDLEVYDQRRLTTLLMDRNVKFVVAMVIKRYCKHNRYTITLCVEHY